MKTLDHAMGITYCLEGQQLSTRTPDAVTYDGNLFLKVGLKIRRSDWSVERKIIDMFIKNGYDRVIIVLER